MRASATAFSIVMVNRIDSPPFTPSLCGRIEANPDGNNYRRGLTGRGEGFTCDSWPCRKRLVYWGLTRTRCAEKRGLEATG